MKLLFDFFPVALFFLSYKFFNIYIATYVIIGASLVQTMLSWIKHRKLESMHLITLGGVLLLGTATLLLHNEMFIKWKPTVVYFVLSILFLASQIFSKKSFLQRLLGEKLNLPPEVWQRLNFTWVLFFAFMGIANLYVAYRYPTDVWVSFKFFGTLGGTLIFIILQSLYMGKYLARSVEGQSNN